MECFVKFGKSWLETPETHHAFRCFRTIFSPETNSETMKTISYFGITRYYFGISTTYFGIFRSNDTELHHENATSHHIFAALNTGNMDFED